METIDLMRNDVVVRVIEVNGESACLTVSAGCGEDEDEGVSAAEQKANPLNSWTVDQL